LGIQHGQQSAYVQERRKWETQPVMIDAQWIAPQMIDGQMREGFMDGTYIQPLPHEQGGKFPYRYQEFPKMLYKAERADGGPRIAEQLIVHSEIEESGAVRRGFVAGQDEAVAAIKAQDREFAKLAAERNHDVRRMSDKAKAEVEAHDDASSIHLPTIPETPIKKRGRPVKVKTDVQ
jgi:hypothetical protein